jgi:spermidine synthase
VRETKGRFFAGIFLISSATLCLEISLIRYFSIAQQYHFAFLVVSIAFLGYGASGSFLSFFQNILKIERDRFLSISSLCFSFSIIISFLLCNAISFDFIKLSWGNSQIFSVFLYYFLLSLPFLFAGATLSFAIAHSAEYVNKIYFADLLGAGSGTLLSLIIFLPNGDRGTIMALSFLALLSSFLFSKHRSYVFRSLLLILLVLEAFLFIQAPRWLSFRISPFKSLPTAMRYPKSQQLLTRWNALARIDIIDSPAVRFAPGLSLLYEKNLPSQLGLSIDGGEINAVTSFQDPEDTSLEFLSSLPSSLAFELVSEPRVLVIEPKGGLDVLTAIVNDSSQIKVIENNPLLVKILKNELASFSGHIYEREDVEVVSSHSRSFLKRENAEYELIIISLTDIFGSSSTGMYGFGENYLFTIEAFTEILDKLSTNGIISTTQYLLPPPRQEIRMLSTWIEALRKQNKDPAQHLLAFRSWGTITTLIKNQPFRSSEVMILKERSKQLLFDLVYYPGINIDETNLFNRFKEPLYFNLFQQLIQSGTRESFLDSYLFDITPVTDDRPFFYNFLKADKFKLTYKALGQKWLPFLQDKFVVHLLLFQSLILSVILIILPLRIIRKKRKSRKTDQIRVFFYFGLIGMAFMFVEITFIQKFILYLSHPLYSAALIIFALLFSSGMGSLFSQKLLNQNIKKRLKISLILAAVFVFVSLFMSSMLIKHFIGLDLSLRMILSFLVIFPVGFLMGFPFPAGIRFISKDRSLIPWAWATNAFSSVISSVLVLIVAFWGGYNLVLILAAGGYLAAALCTGFGSRQ